MNTRVIALALMAVAAAGCSKRDEAAESPPPGAAPARQPAAPETAAFDPIGTWTVVGQYLPGVTAMTAEDAKAFDGRTVTFGAAEALSNDERCTAPKYPARSVDTEDFLAAEFNLPPESLKPLEGMHTVTIVEVACNGAPWTAFGSLLIAVGANRALTPWDGVFFELERTLRPSG